MNLLHVIILSVIEGITEFLPISSTGHLILTANLLGIAQDPFVKSFEVIIQLGAILAAVVLYAKTVLKQKDLIGKILVGFIPSAIVGLTLYKFIKGFLLENVYITLIALFVGGVAFIVLEKFVFNKSTGSKTTLKSLSFRDAVVVGLFQALSIIPGTSRSGASIIGGMLVNMNRKSAVEFSFLLAIPTMLAATVLDLKENAFQFTSTEFLYLGIGLVISFVVAFIVMRWFVQFVQTNTFIPFGIYRIVFSVLYFLLLVR